MRTRTAPAPAMRLDQCLVARGLAATREEAQAAIMAGLVTVDAARADKPGRHVAPDATVALHGPARAYASRGGMKLAAALDAFQIDVRGRVAVDLGASTGGFTDCLLQRGAARVYAVDVGRGQLAWTLRTDARVVVLEGTNARSLEADAVGGPREIVTADLAFISLRLVWPAIAGLIVPDGDVVALIKPQFEAGRARVGRGGVVRDPAVHASVLDDVLRAAEGHGLAPVGLVASPITGPAGNIEYLAYLRRAATPAPACALSLADVVREAHARFAPNGTRP
jgi:23S rRNA (cytidine1920-2'-O)/16S rRNA (cytidine1409-2'-O)-methyltransferase